MTVKELIKLLQKYPMEADVKSVCRAAGKDINHVVGVRPSPEVAVTFQNVYLETE